MNKKILICVFLIMMLFTLTGCWETLDFVCAVAGDSAAHCQQWLAVQSEDSDNCDRVEQAPKFKDMGSNPPQDKCRLMVAEETADPEGCADIKGGAMSYTPEECYLGTATTNENPDLCMVSPNEAACRTKYASTTGTQDCGTGYTNTGGVCVKDTKPDTERVLKPGEGDAVATFTKGTALYRPQGSSTWFPLAQDTELKAGDTIRTGKDSKARIVIKDVKSETIPAGSNYVIPSKKEIDDGKKVPLSKLIPAVLDIMTEADTEGQQAVLGTR